jgi:hypothetical protein
MLESFTHAFWTRKDQMPTTIKTDADRIADKAFAVTASYPAFDPKDRLEAMLSTLRESMEDMHADVLAACRKKAGVK